MFTQKPASIDDSHSPHSSVDEGQLTFSSALYLALKFEEELKLEYAGAISFWALFVLGSLLVQDYDPTRNEIAKDNFYRRIATGCAILFMAASIWRTLCERAQYLSDPSKQAREFYLDARQFRNMFNFANQCLLRVIGGGGAFIAVMIEVLLGAEDFAALHDGNQHEFLANRVTLSIVAGLAMAMAVVCYSHLVDEWNQKTESLRSLGQDLGGEDNRETAELGFLKTEIPYLSGNGVVKGLAEFNLKVLGGAAVPFAFASAVAVLIDEFTKEQLVEGTIIDTPWMLMVCAVSMGLSLVDYALIKSAQPAVEDGVPYHQITGATDLESGDAAAAVGLPGSAINPVVAGSSSAEQTADDGLAASVAQVPVESRATQQRDEALYGKRCASDAWSQAAAMRRQPASNPAAVPGSTNG